MGKLDWSGDLDAVDHVSISFSPDRSSGVAARIPFLRIPPFPGASVRSFDELSCAEFDPTDLVAEIRRLRVGGTYWGAQPQLPANHVLVRSIRAVQATAAQFADHPVTLWDRDPCRRSHRSEPVLNGDCDPWHVLSSASAVVIDADDEVRAIAALAGVPCYIYNGADGALVRCTRDRTSLVADALSGTMFANPFTGEPMTPREAVELCGFWRRLIDSNRRLAGGVGFAFWKQRHVGPLLWGGSEAFKFLRNIAEVAPGAEVAAWRAKASPNALAELKAKNARLIEVEDGFLRSRGLGADCVPPLSLTVDGLGAHFDPSSASELEELLQAGHFDRELLARAGRLRRVIVDAGIAKYERGTTPVPRPVGRRRIILVPGQVEDDRAVQSGGCGIASNLELLRRVRQQAPDACILYKPHPDVIAGHRRGRIPETLCFQYADEIVSDSPIASVIAIADEVHVNTSLAGFEALLRDKPVTTYGVPFYAGWGLTRDLGPVPSRRAAKRTVDELVAATLLVYPRYLDPVTGLPCPAEIVVQRLTGEDIASPGLIVGVRRLQGRLMRRLRSIVQ